MFNLVSKLFLILVGFASFQVNAALVSCTTNIEGLVAGSDSCSYSDTLDKDKPHTGPASAVNQEGFFGITDWKYAGKYGGTDPDEQEAGDIAIGFTLGGAGIESNTVGQAGTWSIDEAAFSTWNSIMLIFKSGSNTTIVGYLLNDLSEAVCTAGVCSGSWGSPFQNPPFNVGETKDTSHITAYVSAVPVPAAVWLFGSGLLGLLGYSRRRATA
jgi:hypothetical protein